MATITQIAANQENAKLSTGPKTEQGKAVAAQNARTHGLSAITLRPFMVYDENEEFGAHRSAMIRFAHGLAQGEPIEVHRGSARGWLHISDALTAIMAASALRDYTVINIGHSDVVATEGLALRLADELGADQSLIKVIEQPPRMTLIKNPSLQRMERVLGVRPAVDLAEGLQRVAAATHARLLAASSHDA